MANLTLIIIEPAFKVLRESHEKCDLHSYHVAILIPTSSCYLYKIQRKFGYLSVLWFRCRRITQCGHFCWQLLLTKDQKVYVSMFYSYMNQVAGYFVISRGSAAEQKLFHRAFKPLQPSVSKIALARPHNSAQHPKLRRRLTFPASRTRTVQACHESFDKLRQLAKLTAARHLPQQLYCELLKFLCWTC